ncbi:hypothetical protein [Acerihabitans arboris]|uniref:Uncharacterized protein n=1 Tax=Acerihabitans arboris TaxID=2691583 RepID=A0A845ST17_9GAMM|nr:hypothetical protein [Acerihabitans arboris]NDL65868.1 hypothetical protein [Acerihabitans arboris]
MPSFFSERTAEYSLVPAVLRALVKEFPSVAPIYFWRTREGNSVSQALNLHKRVRIMAMFARRPKIGKLENFVSGKINESVLNYAKHAREYGIATIGGFIAIDSFLDINNENRYIWFNLCNISESIYDYEFLCKINPCEIITEEDNFRKIKAINIEALIPIVNKYCKPLEWHHGMEIVYKLNQLTSPGSHGFFGRLWGGGYKPVLFLIFD